MKLRIQGNSLRIRITQPELTRFGTEGRVAEVIRFGLGRRLTYALEVSDSAGRLTVLFDDDRLTVWVPSAKAETWVRSDLVSLEGEQPIEGEDVLTILVEKDFQCLHQRPEERDAEAFLHPLMERSVPDKT